MRESLDCVSALGDGLRLEVIDHGDAGAAKEFIVAAPKFNFKKWLTLTLALSFISLTCEIYISDLRVLGAILCLLCFALLIKLRKKIKLESLLVVSSLGLQHTTMYASGRRETFFLSRQRLKSVLIIEGISMQKVLFYLAIVLNSKTELPLSPPSPGLARRSSRDIIHPTSLSRENKQERSTPDILPPSTSLSKIPFSNKNTISTDDVRITTEDVVYPIFQSLWPRLDVLTVVYRGVQTTLFRNNHVSK